MKRILITGASGFLGSHLMKHLDKNHYTLGTYCTRKMDGLEQVDFTDQFSSADFLNKILPDIVIHTVALTNVDDCQKDIQKCYNINVLSTYNIADWIQKKNDKTKLIFISTDQLYDGFSKNSENQVKLTNIYSLTKKAAEEIALMLPNSLILRTNFFGYSPKGNSYFDWLTASLKKYNNVSLFDDVFFSPLYIKVLCKIIQNCIDIELTGLFNLGSHDSVSKYEFAKMVANKFGYSLKNTKKTSICDAQLFAPRPKIMSMDCQKFENAFGSKLPSVKDCLDMIYDDFLRR